MPSRLLACAVFAAFLSFAHADPACVISTRINVDKAPVELKPVTVAFGVAADQEQTHTLFYPTGWDLPQHFSDTAAIPMFPNAFEKEKVGWQVHYVAERKDSYIILHGEAVYTAAARLQRGVYGEESGPITGSIQKDGKPQPMVLCDNRSPNFSFQTTTTHFQVIALPGKPYVVQLQHGTEAVNATITCSLQEGGQPVASQSWRKNGTPSTF